MSVAHCYRAASRLAIKEWHRLGIIVSIPVPCHSLLSRLTIARMSCESVTQAMKHASEGWVTPKAMQVETLLGLNRQQGESGRD